MIKRLHALESSSGYCVPAQNVAKLFGNHSAKEFYSVPEDGKKISRWTHECETKISNLFSDRVVFSNLDLEKVHEFDWECHVNRSALNFAYIWEKKESKSFLQTTDNKQPDTNLENDIDTTRIDLWGKV